MEWVCGYCDTRNIRTKLFSFLRKCQHCKRPPKAYICPHLGCEKINFLSKENNDRHPARAFKDIPPPINEVEVRQKRVQDRTDQKDEKLHELEIAKLDAQLAIFKGTDLFKKLSKREEFEKEFSEFREEHLGIELFVEEQLKQYEKEFAGNALMLKKNKLALRAWAELRFQKRT